MQTCYLFCALPGGAPQVDADDLVIAVDAGYRQLGGIAADYVVGDFDSLGFVPQNETVVRLPVRKDDTDAMFAVKLGLEKGCRRFVVYGGVGERLDHTLANIQALAYLTNRGARGCLVGETESFMMVKNGSVRFFGSPRGTISVFAHGGTARGVTLEGLEYPLDHATITPDFPIGVSNIFTGAPARVTVEDGLLLIVWGGGYGHTDLLTPPDRPEE
jgi:thiamine pyrophosphokinase